MSLFPMGPGDTEEKCHRDVKFRLIGRRYNRFRSTGSCCVLLKPI